MKGALGFASILLLAATASLSSAAGVVSINWDTCTGPTDKTPVPAAPAQKMVISVLGQDEPHRAYDVRIVLSQPRGLKDAWRFDDAGCEGPARCAIRVIDDSTCPAFMQSATGLQIRKYTYDWVTQTAMGLFANAYTDVISPDPATRYLLASFEFDLSFAAPGAGDPPSSCGGLDDILCVTMTNTSWLTLEGEEIEWNKSDPYFDFVTGNGDGLFCGGVVPAQPKTWGSLKVQYRN
jgi:hypothetical protein